MAPETSCPFTCQTNRMVPKGSASSGTVSPHSGSESSRASRKTPKISTKNTAEYPRQHGERAAGPVPRRPCLPQAAPDQPGDHQAYSRSRYRRGQKHRRARRRSPSIRRETRWRRRRGPRQCLFVIQRLIWISAAEGLICRLRVSLPNGRAQAAPVPTGEPRFYRTRGLFHLGLAELLPATSPPYTIKMFARMRAAWDPGITETQSRLDLEPSRVLTVSCHYFTTRQWPDGGAVGSMSPQAQFLLFCRLGLGTTEEVLQHVRLQLEAADSS